MAAGTDDQTQGLQKNSRPANFISREITVLFRFFFRGTKFKKKIIFRFSTTRNFFTFWPEFSHALTKNLPSKNVNEQNVTYFIKNTDGSSTQMNRFHVF